MRASLVMLVLIAACNRPSASPASPPAPCALPALDGTGQAMLSPVRIDVMQPETLVARVGVAPDAVVADIGAGPGAFTHLFARAAKQGKVIATDLKDDYLARIELDARARGETNIEVRRVEPEETGLAAGEVDVAFLCQVDHYLRDRRAYLGKLALSLKPNGRIVIVNYLRERDAIDKLAAELHFREVDRWEPVAGFFARSYSISHP